MDWWLIIFLLIWCNLVNIFADSFGHNSGKGYPCCVASSKNRSCQEYSTTVGSTTGITLYCLFCIVGSQLYCLASSNNRCERTTSEVLSSDIWRCFLGWGKPFFILFFSVERIVTYLSYLFVDWIVSVNPESLKCWLHCKRAKPKRLHIRWMIYDILKQKRWKKLSITVCRRMLVWMWY